MSARLAFEAIGVPWSIETAEPLPDDLRAHVSRRIEDYDATWSRFRADSLVTRIAQAPGRWRLPPEAVPLLALYRDLYELTDGRVTPLVGARLASLGLDPEYTLTPRPRLASVPTWDDAIRWDGETLETLQPVTIDIGAAGKGHLVDLIAHLLEDAGVRDVVVDASGDLVVRGSRTETVALEDPDDHSSAIGVVELADRAICASAPGRRAWGSGIHHILDGRSGEPTTAVAATWAIADSALLADGLATALFFVPADRLAERFDFEFVQLFPDARAIHSPGLPGEVFA